MSSSAPLESQWQELEKMRSLWCLSFLTTPLGRHTERKKKIQFKEIKGEGMEVGSQDVHNGASDVNRRKGRNDDEGGERLC